MSTLKFYFYIIIQLHIMYIRVHIISLASLMTQTRIRARCNIHIIIECFSDNLELISSLYLRTYFFKHININYILIALL